MTTDWSSITLSRNSQGRKFTHFCCSADLASTKHVVNLPTCHENSSYYFPGSCEDLQHPELFPRHPPIYKKTKHEEHNRSSNEVNF